MSRTRVLVVDDDPQIRRVMCRSLGQLGWHVFTATDPDGVTVSRSLSISVSDVNEAPTLSGLAVNAVETGLSLPARLHLPTLTDPEGGTMTLTLTAAPSEGATCMRACMRACVRACVRE